LNYEGFHTTPIPDLGNPRFPARRAARGSFLHGVLCRICGIVR